MVMKVSARKNGNKKCNPSVPGSSLGLRMCSAVDRTSDFIRSVQLSRSKLNEFKRQDELSSNSFGNHVMDHTSLGMPKANSNDSVFENNISHKINVPNGSMKNQDHSNKKSTALSQRSQFMKAASVISQDLTNTFSKLEQLNALARKQTLFDDHSSEIQHLTYVIKESIANLNNRIANLQEISKSQVSVGKQQSTHSRSVLMVLQTHLAKMSDQFRGVLEYRSENIKSQNARKSKYSSLDDKYESSETMSSVKPPHVVIPEALLSEKQGNDGLDGLGNLGPSTLPINSNLGLAQKYINPDQTDSYLLSRSDAMQSIEHTIVELGQIFQQLATMVHEQDESIRRIDANVDDATISIEAGHSELIRYFNSISSSRWLMIKVFFVLIIFFVIFVKDKSDMDNNDTID
ncbi:putative syntaxin [Schistosoma mansoni]|uniref:putative syntaxin n=1 Tax=Schistosoma mansoni TaxID=6183 RepID=UPI0001A62B38|nr:putative syntaxin [Schistosoma mansoni]|eukprot:XP_018653343.1 putative syntaxin [Schistosoma mansoni]